MGDSITLYHNPRCSKSRQALALIEQAGHSPKVVLYLQQAPSPDELRQLVQALGFSHPKQLLRTNEALYKSLGLNNETLSEAAVLLTMSQNPILIERPIALKAGHAIIGRPPENILPLL